eukprot:TRINITY_DN1769_c0_g3_i2.p1 TRINITY_DN1769_c0_g3~~TRINITY_DN1769_c0_g3_i2.p1  ORF type:complete len:168 (-),score=41.44 TRINITY_DN1769_c0_g3_i2:203-658(-)
MHANMTSKQLFFFLLTMFLISAAQGKVKLLRPFFRPVSFIVQNHYSASRPRPVYSGWEQLPPSEISLPTNVKLSISAKSRSNLSTSEKPTYTFNFCFELTASCDLTNLTTQLTISNANLKCVDSETSNASETESKLIFGAGRPKKRREIEV